MVHWDNGSQLKVVLGVDTIEVFDRIDRLYVCGQLVSHFKRGCLSAEELRREPAKHLYRILSPAAINTETNDDMVVYQALYAPFLTFCRPTAMAKELVDWSKYPDVPIDRRQAYRLMEYDISKMFKEESR